MNERQLTAVLAGLMMAAAISMVALWFLAAPRVKVEQRLTDFAAEQRAGTLKAPGNHIASIPQPSEEEVDIRGTFEKFNGQPGASSSSWPRFRGADFSNRSSSGPPLAEKWGDHGPPVLWSVQLSEGHSGPAVWNGCVYLMDYDEKREGDALRCFSFQDGKEIWRRWYHAPTKRNHGVSRTVPAVTEEFIVTMGPRCHVMCVDRATGDFRWGIDLVRERGAEVPLWYTGQCPLIDDGVAVLAPCGKEALLMGVDCKSGKILWETPNTDSWKMSHSSIVPMTLLGRRMYVYGALGGAVGISAESPDRGKVLWKTSEWKHSVLAPSPVAVDAQRVFLTAGYGGGSMMIGLAEEAGAIRAATLFKLEKTVFSCEQHTPLFYQGCLFGILPKDAAELRAQFACLNLDGQLIWTSGKTERFGLGPFLLADEKIFILNDTGELTLIRASPQGYERLARARVLHGRDAWAPMALVDGKLLLRDSEQLICLDVRKSESTSLSLRMP
jgi:outer membrane protein assembly factor BamB